MAGLGVPKPGQQTGAFSEEQKPAEVWKAMRLNRIKPESVPEPCLKYKGVGLRPKVVASSKTNDRRSDDRGERCNSQCWHWIFL